MSLREAYLVRTQSGTHYVMRPNGQKATENYAEVCEALLTFCR